MSLVTVEIWSNQDPRYIPSNRVRYGDQVVFHLNDIPGEVDVSFDGASCFVAPGPYVLNGSTLATSSSEQTVADGIDPGPYDFSVALPGLRRHGEKEVKKGELEVTTDPPEDDKSK